MNKRMCFSHNQYLKNPDHTHISRKNIQFILPGYFCLFMPILFILLLSMELQGNTRWRISAESGFYQRNQLENGKPLHFVSRLNGYLTFQNRSRSNLWWLSLRLKPELYQDVINYTAMKMITKGFCRSLKVVMQMYDHMNKPMQLLELQKELFNITIKWGQMAKCTQWVGP